MNIILEKLEKRTEKLEKNVLRYIILGITLFLFGMMVFLFTEKLFWFVGGSVAGLLLGGEAVYLSIETTDLKKILRELRENYAIIKKGEL